MDESIKQKVLRKAGEVAWIITGRADTKYRLVGDWMVGPSPFRPGSDSDGFHWHPDNGHFKDHVSGEKGDVFDLAAKSLGLPDCKGENFVASLKYCADILGISVQESGARSQAYESGPEALAKKRKRRANPSFHQCLAEYGLDADDAEALGWRYDKKRCAIAYPVSLESGEELWKFKPLRRDDNGKRLSPSFSLTGKQPGKGFTGKLGSAKGKPLVVTGGEEKAAVFYRCGIPAISLLSGESSPPGAWVVSQIKQARSAKVIVCLDADEAGRKATRKWCEVLVSARVHNVHFVAWGKHVANGYDANDAYLDGGEGALQGLIQNAINWLEHDHNETAKRASSGNDEYPDPEPPRDIYSANLPPFPMKCLPPWLQDAVGEISNTTQTPACLAAFCSLGLASLAFRGWFEIRGWPGFREPVSLFLLAAMESGERKSPVFKSIFAPLYEYQSDIANRERSKRFQAETNLAVRKDQAQKALKAAQNGEADAEAEHARLMEEIAEIKTSMRTPQLICQDTTAEAICDVLEANQGHASIIDSEGGVLSVFCGLYNSGRPNIDVLLKGYSGEPLVVNRRNREDPIVLARTQITMLLTAQPAVIEALGRIAMLEEKGFLARFLIVYPKPIRIRNAMPGAMKKDVMRHYKSAMRRLLEMRDPRNDASKRVLINSTGEAQEVLKALHDDLEQRRRNVSGDLFSLRSWANKLHGQACRIAAILHALKQTSDPEWHEKFVDNETMLDACNIIQSFVIPHGKYAFGAMRAGESRVNMLCRGIVELLQSRARDGRPAILSHRFVGPSHWSQALAIPRVSKSEMRDAAEALEETGWAMPKYDERGDKLVSITLNPKAKSLSYGGH